MKRYEVDSGKARARARFREFLRPRIHNRKDQHVLCFPGEHGFEIEQVYRKLGFRDENIHGVERDPRAAKAIREKYPNITLFEGDLVDFVTSYDGPPFAVASFDFCGHYGQDKMVPIAVLCARGLLQGRSVVGLNLLAGRETTKPQTHMRESYARMLLDRSSSLEDMSCPRIDEAIAAVVEASGEDLAVVRDNAITHDLLAVMSYSMPAVFACWRFDLQKAAGTAFHLTPSTEKSYSEKGELRLSNVRRVEDPQGVALALQIKHEAIAAINEELQLWGVPEAAKRSARQLGIPSAFFDYHLGRTLVMAWFDTYGRPLLPTALERYSYISNSGKRMVSDFVEVRSFEKAFQSLPEMVAPYTDSKDPDAHRFRLTPCPNTLSQGDYLERLRSLVFGYADKIARHVKLEPDQWPLREDLGGGPQTFDEEKAKNWALQLLRKGRQLGEVASKTHLSLGTLRALKAHLTMGTYDS